MTSRRDHWSMLFFVFVLIFHSHMIILLYSKSIIRTLPGYAGDLPFKLETGYIGVGEKEDVQLFYYFVESTRNPEVDPLIFYIPGGPGSSCLHNLLDRIGPLNFDLDKGEDNFTLILNPNAWTQIANIVFMDIPVGTGFSYAKTNVGWISSDNIQANQACEFIKKFLIDHPKFLKNPLYVHGMSYSGIVIPKIALDLYEGNEQGDQPTLNIQGYILINPLTDKFKDFNSRFEYAHRMALISDDIYKSALENCYGNYVDFDTGNYLCTNSLHQYQECTSQINVEHILENFCDVQHDPSDCKSEFDEVLEDWANSELIQNALNICQGKIGRFELHNYSMHYYEGKNDTFSYSYNIFSSVAYHRNLSRKICQSLILSGDHDMTFPYVGVEQWINSLNLKVEIPWKPFYVESQVGGYEMKYTKDEYSLTYATIRGAGHLIPKYKPKETFIFIKRWFWMKHQIVIGSRVFNMDHSDLIPV